MYLCPVCGGSVSFRRIDDFDPATWMWICSVEGTTYGSAFRECQLEMAETSIFSGIEGLEPSRDVDNNINRLVHKQ